ncbi:ribonuclease III [Helcococcus ovis]|uniref:Ribonuclease 3 n=2 Tax=Helcococcus ovis TaxID=72026 RepID=A0A4V3IYF1_9FIRM|nr:ribonuclease III [Helcococcus ovis]TFF64887.1 ribonuclease III [Helcococcus ovis]TFF67164.1 ribonuclease III [Helcococcus ovis]TFF67941.1 ribonuclease III [Helcococcus ovis]WNZ01896.1 ribonuclease III [Helcococcus ovis]
MTRDRIAKLDKLEKKINYKFNDINLLNLAFIHTSYTNEHPNYKNKSNERLEFLGDAVCELAFSEILYKNFKPKQEGFLTKVRANLVCEKSFSEFADQLGLAEFLLLGKGEEKTGGREKPSIKSDAFEAVMGALYLDGGYDVVFDLIYNLIIDKVKELKIQKESVNDYKSMLQEYLHKKNKSNIVYRLVNEIGPSHDKLFYFELYIEDKMISEGKGKNKKIAEQMAAKTALEKIGVLKK